MKFEDVAEPIDEHAEAPRPRRPGDDVDGPSQSTVIVFAVLGLVAGTACEFTAVLLTAAGHGWVSPALVCWTAIFAAPAAGAACCRGLSRGEWRAQR